MIGNYSLRGVIDEVPSAIALTSNAEKIITIDVSLKKAVPKKRMFHGARLFLVRNSSDGRSGAECTLPPIQIRDFNNDRNVAVSIDYFATCDPGNEEKIAESLFDGPHPGAVLNEKINKYLIDYIGHRPAEFIDNYFHKESDLQSYIAARVHQEVGLTLRVKVRLPETPLQPIPIGSFSLSVRVRDCDENQTLNVRGELQVDELNKVNAVLSKSDGRKLEDLVKQEIQAYTAEHITLHSFFTDLNDGVKKQLMRHLNRALESSGRKLAFLALECPSRDSVAQPFFETTHDVKCNIHQYPDPVVIKNSVQMIVSDLGRYRANGAPPLEDWVKKKLDRVIHELLFDAKYINLLLDFEPREEEIKHRLGAEAESIGYGLKQLITVPDLEPLSWLKSFQIEVEDSFETQSPGVKVKLKLVATVRIQDLRDIRSYLDHRQDVPELMKELIVRETRRFLHTIDPERFYMRFSFTDIENELAVHDALIETIRDALEKEFRAEVIDVIPKVADTKYIEHLRELQAQIGTFMIGLSPVGQDEFETFIYRGIFRVESVHASGWDKFRLLNSSMETIQSFLEESVGAKMETLPGDTLAYQNYPDLRSMEELVEKLARECIVKEFGIVIRIPTIRREKTGLEGKAGALRRGNLEKSLELEETRAAASLAAESQRIDHERRAGNFEAESLLALIAKLEEKRREYAGKDGAEVELPALDKEIARYKKMLRKGSLAPLEKPRPLYASNSSLRTRLEDFGVPSALPPAPQATQLAADEDPNTSSSTTRLEQP